MVPLSSGACHIGRQTPWRLKLPTVQFRLRVCSAVQSPCVGSLGNFEARGKLSRWLAPHISGAAKIGGRLKCHTPRAVLGSWVPSLHTRRVQKNACVFSLHARWLNFLRVFAIFDPEKNDFAHAACCDSGFVVLFAHAACCDSGFAVWRSAPSNPTARLTTFSNTP